MTDMRSRDEIIQFVASASDAFARFDKATAHDDWDEVAYNDLWEALKDLKRWLAAEYGVDVVRERWPSSADAISDRSQTGPVSGGPLLRRTSEDPNRDSLA